MPSLDLSPFGEDDLRDVCALLSYARTGDLQGLGGGGRPALGATLARRIHERRRQLGGALWDPQELVGVQGLGQSQVEALLRVVRTLDIDRLRLTCARPSGGNLAEMVVDGPDCLAALLAEIGKARRFVHVQVMLFFSDEVGWQVAKALAARARAGVEVRVMADAAVTRSGWSAGSTAVETAAEADFGAITRLLEEAGAQVIDTSQETYWDWEWDERRARMARAGVPEHFLVQQDLVQEQVNLNWNCADHRKFLVIDGETSIIGSFNVGGNYLYADPLDADGLPAGRAQWHDGFLVVRGPLAADLNELFASTWMVRGGGVFDYTAVPSFPAPLGDAECKLLSCFPGGPVNPIREHLLALAEGPVGPVFIENPYINDDAFYDRLAGLTPALARQVTLINAYTAKASDYPLQKESVRCHMRRPFERGVRFVDYASGRRMAHWKTALDEAPAVVLHGSYNINMRSARHDFETCALVRSPTLARQVKAQLDHDQAVSSQVTDGSQFYKNPLLHVACAKEELMEYFS